MTSPLQSPLQPVMRSPLEFRRRGGGSFDIASTNPSAYYDRTNLATLFQNNLGNTPVDAAAQPIGLGLDQSQGLALGPEMVDITPDTIQGDWTNNGDGSYTSDGSGYLQWFGLSAGKWYKFSFRIVSATSGGISEVSSIPTSSGTGTFVGYSFGSTVASFYAAGLIGTADSFSAREIAGNHQLQADAGKRPIADGTPIYANFDGVDDDLGATFPASLGAGCTVCRSLPGIGASITTGVTLTATYTDNVDAHFLAIYTAAQWAALDAGQIANITALLNAKAGL